MTQYTRSVIPGRAQPDDRPLDRELDRMVFGRQQGERAAAVSEPDAPAPRVSSRKSAPVSMDDDDAPPEHLFTERAPRDRRKAAPRRKTDYVPLTEDANQKAADASKRGPLILVVTLVVIGVFGAVVWNAYSSGLRAPDGGPTPELSSAGQFKTRPVADASKPADIDASVFERVEKAPAPAVTQEVRPEVVSEPKPEPVKVEAVKLEPVKPAPVKPTPVKVEAPAPTKAETPAKTTVAPAAEKPAPTLTVAAPAPKPVTVAAATPAVVKPAKAAEAPAKPATALTTTADAAVPAPPALEGGGAFHPAFAASGAYVVQLAAPSTEAAAQAEWARRAKAAPALLAPAEKLVVKADVNGKTVYRLRAGSFASSADADAFCGAIKASGGACFTAKK